MKITAISLELGQTRVFISPMSPKNTEKGEKMERKREREKKRLPAVFSFQQCGLSERQKNKAKKLPDASLGRPGSQKSRYIYICIYIYTYIYLDL